MADDLVPGTRAVAAMSTKLPLGALLFFGLLLLLSNRWLTYEEGITLLKASDTRTYMALARSAPALEQHPDAEFHHLQRVAGPWVVGTFARITGVSHETSFLLFALLLILGFLYILHRILVTLGLEGHAYLLCMSLALFNPYVVRYYLAVPGMLADLIFVVGMGIAALGLLRGGFAAVAIGLTIAALGRQTALLTFPGFTLWFFLGEAWQDRPLGKKCLYSAIVLAIVTGVYVLSTYLARLMGSTGSNLSVWGGLYRWLRDSFDLGVLIELAIKAVLPLSFPLLILAGFARGTRQRIVDRRASLLCFFIIICLLSQPLLGDPTLFMSNMNRYSSQVFIWALIPLVVALAKTKALRDIDPITYGVLIASLVTGSFQHVYTFIGGDTSNAARFALIYGTMAIAAGAAACYGARHAVSRSS
jgi:hypothetical protein